MLLDYYISAKAIPQLDIFFVLTFGNLYNCKQSSYEATYIA